MTDADRAALKALVEQWRAKAAGGDHSISGGAWEAGEECALERCADELAALIAAGLSEAPAPQIIAVVDGRCGCASCKERTEDIYRMVGTCFNCGAKPILMLFRAGDPSASQDCPVCGKWHGVQSQRLATSDEIPALASPAPPKEPR